MNKLIIIFAVVLMNSCTSQGKISKEVVDATEPFLIYKTKADYSQNVPIILNAEKTVIVSYPAPSDLMNGDELRIPTSLGNGYFLDNKGISSTVAFTSYTFANYAKMKSAPSIEELQKSIIDNDPLLELYDCRAQQNIKYDLAKMKKIVEQNFEKCIKLK